MANPVKQQLTDDLKKVKLQSGDRAQRIKTIFKTAFSEAMTEIKDGTQDVKAVSKTSLDNVMQSVAPQDAREAVVTVAVSETVSEAVSEAISEENISEHEAAAAPEAEATSAEASTTAPENSAVTVLQTLLKAAGLKAKDLTGEQYSKLKAELPEHLEQLKGKTTAWDEQLSDRYGEDYAGLKQRFNKALAWYKAKLAEGKAVNDQSLKNKQAQPKPELSDLGTKVAQKEEAVKQKIGQTLRTITVNAQS